MGLISAYTVIFCDCWQEKLEGLLPERLGNPFKNGDARSHGSAFNRAYVTAAESSLVSKFFLRQMPFSTQPPQISAQRLSDIGHGIIRCEAERSFQER
jgi:hypothetical protein